MFWQTSQFQAGKTTRLNALAGSIPPRERVITCEEVFELRIAHRDLVAMQCRQPSLEGTGEITLRRLVKEALRGGSVVVVIDVHLELAAPAARHRIPSAPWSGGRAPAPGS